MIFIIAINYEFKWDSQLTTSIRTKCSARERRILGSRLCQNAPFENEFDLIEAKGRGVNEQVNFGIYIRHLDKYEVEVFTVFTMQKQILFATNFWYHILEGRAITLWQRTHCELVNWLSRCMFGLQYDTATKSRASNHGDLQYGPVHSSCRCHHLHLLCWWYGDRPSCNLGLPGKRIRVWVG